MNHWGVSSCCTNPPVAKAHHRNDANTPKIQPDRTLILPSLPTRWGNHCGPDDRDCPPPISQNHCAQEGSDTIDIWLCTSARHRDGVDMPDAGLHPHREAMRKQHTQPGPSCCVPFDDPQVHKVTPSKETKQECSHSNANTWVPVHHMTRTQQIDDKSKERKRRGYISKEFCAKTDLCPLASPRVALVGVCPLGTPTMATRGEARGHP